MQWDHTASLASRKMGPGLCPLHNPPGHTLSRPCCHLCSPSPRRSSPDPAVPVAGSLSGAMHLPESWHRGGQALHPHWPLPGNQEPRGVSGHWSTQSPGWGRRQDPSCLQAFRHPPRLVTGCPGSHSLPLVRPQTHKYLQTSRKRTNKIRSPTAPPAQLPEVCGRSSARGLPRGGTEAAAHRPSRSQPRYRREKPRGWWGVLPTRKRTKYITFSISTLIIWSCFYGHARQPVPTDSHLFQKLWQ